MWVHFDPMNIVSYDIYLMYDYILVQSAVILICIYCLFLVLMKGSVSTLEWAEMPYLETLWTIYPIFIVLMMVFPSVYVLYKINFEVNYLFSLKIIGHQWYWSYDYSALFDVFFDSYTVPVDMLECGETRLMDVDNRLVLPVKVFLQLLMTSFDVIHSFSIPSIGVKVDCNPGYLNMNKTFFSIPGVYYGLCSEICGSAHSQMSICCEVTTLKLFKTWVGLLV